MRREKGERNRNEASNRNGDMKAKDSDRGHGKQRTKGQTFKFRNLGLGYRPEA